MKALSAALVFLPLLAQQGVNFYSIEKERALGGQLAAEIRQKSKPLENSLIDEYVKRVGGRLASYLTESPFAYTFEAIVTAEMTEPMSIPGGRIFIPAGFFLAARDENEFAGMLAHVIGHGVLRHGTRTATRAEIVNMASVPLVYMGGWLGSHADSRRPPQVPLGFLKFQRTYELEADSFGLELAARAGFDAAALRRYIERTQPPDSQMLPLPERTLRLAGIDESLRSLRVSPSGASGDFPRVQQAVKQALGQPEQRRPPTLRR